MNIIYYRDHPDVNVRNLVHEWDDLNDFLNDLIRQEQAIRSKKEKLVDFLEKVEEQVMGKRKSQKLYSKVIRGVETIEREIDFLNNKEQSIAGFIEEWNRRIYNLEREIMRLTAR